MAHPYTLVNERSLDRRLMILAVFKRVLATAGFAWLAWSIAHDQLKSVSGAPAAPKPGVDHSSAVEGGDHDHPSA